MLHTMPISHFHVTPEFTREFTIELATEPGETIPVRLLLTPTVAAAFAEPFAPLKAWLHSVKEFSQIQPEQGADWIQIRFYFQMQPFCLHYEHYSDCYWIDADSQASLVLLSQLAEFIASIEHNHRLSQP
ncbi:DUF3630 family protein [Rheinheimera riviphila]|uniref:DUF3630 family protein n=1 Tax=Rheinheimera riviphila TaxID=1834037 RepID=A0A437R5D9_9GAMM|nr:DUF3630 family protein [Rheinheimera riviphila]RVU41953.1 DUF3630 family protein [Rheinheimera riviphila]